ncbi:hypothetical protein MML48_2g00006256 [Holotrichia oblita]|uniref:Uncharacterized protein n=1 Tax=Holotrichia oblita TaxID=644536 RepID=A0ACB9TKP9_HOLOL|nr:hypothetical protein MML48_2g00006256 [Holotrichia oblita]
MPRGQGEWLTPVAHMRNMENMFTKLEKTDILQHVDLEKDISYFRNERAKGHTAAFDLFFSYTKTFPLFDPRKCRDDRKYLPDTWENIYEQEEGKPVPALTSMLYGRRPLYDSPPGKHNRRAHIQNFYRKRQVFAGPEKQRFTEDVNFNI